MSQFLSRTSETPTDGPGARSAPEQPSREGLTRLTLVDREDDLDRCSPTDLVMRG